jgi:hypothetical protein
MIVEPGADEFRLFMDTSNYASRLMLAHFFAIEHILGEFALAKVMNSFAFRRKIISHWVAGIAKTLPPSHQVYIKWPLQLSTTIQQTWQ